MEWEWLKHGARARLTFRDKRGFREVVARIQFADQPGADGRRYFGYVPDDLAYGVFGSANTPDGAQKYGLVKLDPMVG